MVDELRSKTTPSGNNPKNYAILKTTSNSVTILLDQAPTSAYNLIADTVVELSDLSGSNEPAFSESYHDVLIEGTLAKEYKKLEKTQLAKDAKAEYESRLSDLRMFVAKSGYLDIQQGKTKSGSGSISTGGGSSTLGQTAYTQTSLVTFDRDPSAPFAVTDTSAYVANLYVEGVQVTTDSLVGRDAAGTGESTNITLDDTLEFTGSNTIQRAALTGDVTSSAGSNVTAIAAGVIVTADIADDQVTYAKMQDIATDSLIGRDTAATGSPETIGLNATLSMDGAGNLQRAALTGDVTASAGSNATTIPNDTVTFAKMQNISAASRLLGRGSAAGSGDTEEITLGTGLSLSGTTLATTAAATATRCQVTNSTVQTLTTGTETVLTFDTEIIDTDTMHSTSSNTGRITVITAGDYFIGFHTSVPAYAAGDRYAYIRLNGTTPVPGTKDGTESYAASSEPTGLGAGVLVTAALNDYYEVIGRHDRGSDGDFGSATAELRSSFFAVRLG